MKKTQLILTIVLCSSYSIAQSYDLEFDHYTILVKNLEKSAEFYENILQLKEVDTPWGEDLALPVLFFDIGNNQQLHVTQQENESIKLSKIIHIAYTVKDFDGYLEFLNEKGIEYGDWSGKNKKFQTRIDGVKQIYFQDPDGYWIEINNNAQHYLITK
jgi:catechol 2,3-dioxygenase-like lactoylglutathione lyase family enzyme